MLLHDSHRGKRPRSGSKSGSMSWRRNRTNSAGKILPSSETATISRILYSIQGEQSRAGDGNRAFSADTEATVATQTRNLDSPPAGH